MLDRSSTAQDDAAPPAPRRRSPTVPLLVAVLAAAAVALRPQQVLSTLSSPKALLLVLAVVLATLLLRRLARPLPAPVATAIAAVPVVIALVLLVLPTLRSTTVDEDLPGLRSAESAAAPGAAAGGGAPARLAVGDVEGIGHRGSGTASLVRLPGGALVVRFEDLSVDPGPDYRVYLVPGHDRSEPGDGIALGKLKASSGNQNYDVPDDVVADGPHTALIWCEAFSVAIAAASLR